MLPTPGDPNSIIPVILIIILRRIRSVIVVSNWRRRGHKKNRGPDKESKVGTPMRVVSVTMSMPGPGRHWPNRQGKD